jgi:hypothetical protein
VVHLLRGARLLYQISESCFSTAPRPSEKEREADDQGHGSSRPTTTIALVAVSVYE